jgi:ABC-type transport system involved in multi-copper enzyme maturation permease subunit
MNTILTIARLTIREAQRRRILWVGLLMGLAFLAVFGIGIHFIYQDLVTALSPEGVYLPLTFITLAALYASNFLVTMVSVLIAVATISGEVENHTIDTVLTKPLYRWQVVAGKWLAFAAISLLFVLLVPGGIMAIAYLRTGFAFDNIPSALGLVFLEGVVALTVTIAGGTRLSTLANGALAFMLYGIAFVGGWVEQIGAILRNETAVDLGIIASLLMPSEILWKKATSLMEPRLSSFTDDFAGPFTVSSQPSDAMIVYAFIYVAALLAFAIWTFSKRDL